jgi:acyl carrier protein
MNKSKVIEILKTALEIEDLNENDSSESIEEWDSLGQLSILSALDKETKGKASSVKGLAEMFSVEEIIRALNQI